MPQNYISQHPMFNTPAYTELPPMLQYGVPGGGGPGDPFAPYQPTQPTQSIPTPVPAAPDAPLLGMPLDQGGLDYGQPAAGTAGGYFDPMDPAQRGVLQNIANAQLNALLSNIPYLGPLSQAAAPMINALQLGPTADAFAAQQAYAPSGGFDVAAVGGDPAAHYADLAATGYLGAGPGAYAAQSPAAAGQAAAAAQAGNGAGSVGGVEAAAEAAFGSAADNAMGWW